MRIDQALIKREFFKTRTKAKEALLAGIVYYAGKEIKKPGFDVSDISLLEIRGNIMPYVSRGGLKLEKALLRFGIELKEKTVLDIGSSTGGFTDCALKNGAKKVIAVDVGSNQMDPDLRALPAVALYEQTDFRDMDLSLIREAQFASIDVSFISVRKMLDKLAQLPFLEEIVCLIKPQFECGKEIADQYRGVIRNKQVHLTVLKDIVSAFSGYGFYCRGLTFSPIAGGSGNREYLACFTKTRNDVPPDFEGIVSQAFDEIPNR